MQLFVTTLHVILCFLLVLIILLQPGKGDASAMFGGGGGGNKKYTARGAGNVLGKATTVVAILFMVTSITLALYSNESVREGSNIEDDILRIQDEMEQEQLDNPAPADPQTQDEGPTDVQTPADEETPDDPDFEGSTTEPDEAQVEDDKAQ